MISLCGQREEYCTNYWQEGCLGNCTCISASTAECEEEDKWTLTNVLSGSKLEEERQRRESEGRHHLTSSSQHGAGT